MKKISKLFEFWKLGNQPSSYISAPTAIMSDKHIKGIDYAGFALVLAEFDKLYSNPNVDKRVLDNALNQLTSPQIIMSKI